MKRGRISSGLTSRVLVQEHCNKIDKVDDALRIHTRVAMAEMAPYHESAYGNDKAYYTHSALIKAIRLVSYATCSSVLYAITGNL